MWGVAGAFFAAFLGVVNSTQFEFSFSIFIFAMVVLGGLGSIPGVVVGAIVLSVVNNYLLPDVLYDLPSRVGLNFDLSQIAPGIYGAILVLMTILRPQGIVPVRRQERSDVALEAGSGRRLSRRRGLRTGVRRSGLVALHAVLGARVGDAIALGAAVPVEAQRRSRRR